MGAPASINRREFSWNLYVLAQLIFLLGLTTKSKRFRTSYFFVLAGIACYLTWFTTTGNAVHDYGIGTHLFTFLFSAFDLLILTDAHCELRITEGSSRGKNIDEEPFWIRVRWALKLQGSPRGLGWSFAAKEPYIAPAPQQETSRCIFIMAKLREIALNIVLYDLAGFINRANPCFSQHGCRLSQMSMGEGRLPVLAWRYAFLGYGVASYLTVSTLHYIYAVLSFGLGLSDPWQWPPLFGSFWDAFTVRRFWGRVWHQMMRRFLFSITTKAAWKLGLPRGRRLTEVFQLFLAFFISAMIHYAGGDYMIFGRWHGGSLIFFSLQPLAIVVEGALIWLAHRVGISQYIPSTLRRLVGLLWVATWFAYTIPMMAEPQLDVGFFECGLSFSLILGIWKGEWSPKV
ncbi:membrane bound O-acyl transferase family-domain-containing protein [Crepidotus variabilis]|uniref:Membrane bound O-acyl transferase family-domain-containing protein n=1 Tax=Crepidotus variabilis TaxID=179855 RepID=A0A9P6JNC9_9AGAR|nr:membrane bound O-acyl transferase family-domain-containing protein [Crepidotus variabilis]